MMIGRLNSPKASFDRLMMIYAEIKTALILCVIAEILTVKFEKFSKPYQLSITCPSYLYKQWVG